MNVTVYGKNPCVQCNATYRTLDKKGIPFSKVNIMADEEAHIYVTQELGHQQAPVVTVKDDEGTLLDHWSGYNEDKIVALAPAS